MRPSPSDKKTQLLLDAASKRFKSAFAAGRFSEALNHCLQASRIAPALATPWSDAAVCYVKLEHWDDAIACAHRAVERQSAAFATYDALAHAFGVKKGWAEVRRWGMQALALRLKTFTGDEPLPHAPPQLPPPPSAATRQHNLIAFSLFGAQAKYCECAVLNATERERIYPDWTCRFYIDDSVPQQVVQRLEIDGSEVIRVSAAQKARWPGPMWRFLAYDTPGLHRVIFRDVDSVINAREAGAVREWIASDQRFHLMRDAATHTELMLAGLWGCVGGALPVMTALVDRFLAKPIASQHFADQLFLRQYVWPYARKSLLQHDSVFGFLEPRPFPDGPTPTDLHVGYAEGSPVISASAAFPDGTPVKWTLYRIDNADGQHVETAICTYPSIVKDTCIIDNLPRRYIGPLQAGQLLIRVTERPV